MGRPRKNPIVNNPATTEDGSNLTLSNNEIATEAFTKDDLPNQYCENTPDTRMSVLEAQIKALADQNTQLLAALLKNKMAEDESQDKTLYSVTLVGTSACVGLVPTPSGKDKKFSWASRGQTHRLTKAQIAHLQEKSPHWFKNGVLSVPALEERNPNVIPDLDKFVAGITMENLNKTINEIDSLPTLWAIFHHIESMRFEPESVKTSTGILNLVPKEISPIVMALQTVVIRKLTSLANIEVRLEN